MQLNQQQINRLVEEIKLREADFSWYGGRSAADIHVLEELLKVTFPPSLREFLLAYGGGGFFYSGFSGINESGPTSTEGGTIYGDTMRVRELYSIPEHLIVVMSSEDEMIWCLDYRQIPDESGEIPVVSIELHNSVYSGSIQKDSDSFGDFLMDHLTVAVEN